jgi:hypothetical protein
MRKRILCSAAALALLAASSGWAQDSPTTFVMGTYYRCVQGDATRADAIYKEHVLPFLKAEQAAGRITAYGWAKHWEGGDWRRLEYVTGTDLDKMVDSRVALIKLGQAPEHAKATDEFDRVCSSHDDYIWSSKASSQAPDAVARVRSPFALSTYYECTSNEDEADAIVKTAFAPILNQHVKDGKIASWNWLEHRMGGKYRRAMVLDGASEKAILKYWGALSGEFDKAQPEFNRRFGEICSSHTDYIWDFSGN